MEMSSRRLGKALVPGLAQGHQVDFGGGCGWKISKGSCWLFVPSAPPCHSATVSPSLLSLNHAGLVTCLDQGRMGKRCWVSS